jgi:hypothetical protein
VTLTARCLAIAAREARSGDGAFAVARDALTARYGACDDHALLTHLATDLRAGVFDRPTDARDRLVHVLWDLTLPKLRDSNPEYLAANGLT